MNEPRLQRTLTIYVCAVKGCQSFFGIDDPDAPDGDHGWNPDGWPRCSTHERPMRPVRVEEVRESPADHPAGCFYGSFAEAYDEAWHIPAGVECGLDHGAKPIRLGGKS